MAWDVSVMGSSRLNDFVAAFHQYRVLCLGDIMVDRYITGTVERISAEAPIPVMLQESETLTLGGVGNVARNVVALGGQATIVSFVGDDEAGREAARLIADDPRIEADLVTVSNRKTTLKTRYLAKGQQLLRADHEDVRALDADASERLISAFRAALVDCDIVIISDYAKGCLFGSVLGAAIEAAKAAGKIVVADPKQQNFERYNGVTILKPNAYELSQSTNLPCRTDEEVETAVSRAQKLTNFAAILITRSEQGMTLAQSANSILHFRERQITEMIDISGARDTATAVLALAVIAGATYPEAAAVANKACALVVSKMRTAVVANEELLQELELHDVFSTGADTLYLAETYELVERWKREGLKVGMTFSCPNSPLEAEIERLARARSQCDRLILGLRDGASSEDDSQHHDGHDKSAAAFVLAGLALVDSVFIDVDQGADSAQNLFQPDFVIDA